MTPCKHGSIFQSKAVVVAACDCGYARRGTNGDNGLTNVWIVACVDFARTPSENAAIFQSDGVEFASSDCGCTRLSRGGNGALTVFVVAPILNGAICGGPCTRYKTTHECAKQCKFENAAEAGEYCRTCGERVSGICIVHGWVSRNSALRNGKSERTHSAKSV